MIFIVLHFIQQEISDHWKPIELIPLPAIVSKVEIILVASSLGSDQGFTQLYLVY